MDQSMSVTMDRPGGRRHNVVAEYREGLAHVDATRTKYNEVIDDNRIEDVYDKLFGEAVERYNAEQDAKGHPERAMRPGNKHDSYLSKLRESKREKPSYEAVIQIGNVDTNPATDERCRQLSTMIYREWLDEFKRNFPHFAIVIAAIHNDEGTPHLHIEYVPHVHNTGVRGMEEKNSLNQARKLDGCPTTDDMNDKMFELLEDVAKRHGVYRIDAGCTSKHVSVDKYKQMLSTTKQKDYPYKNDPALVQSVLEMSDALEQYDKEVECATEVLQKVAEIEKATPLNLRRVNAVIEESRQVCDTLYPKRSLLQGLVQKAREVLAAAPPRWRDFVINPVSEWMRETRERFAQFVEGQRQGGYNDPVGGWDRALGVEREWESKQVGRLSDVLGELAAQGGTTPNRVRRLGDDAR